MSKQNTTIRFTAKLNRPGGKDAGSPWIFLRLPQEASEKLPTRSMQSVEGSLNGKPLAVTLEPDGDGGHWLRVESDLRDELELSAGEIVEVEVAPVKVEPEPKVPSDFKAALDDSTEKARETWESITPMARRDWIFWIVTGKKADTRVKRISVALDKLSKGNRRPCCFDRSGMYDKSLSCPIADDE